MNREVIVDLEALNNIMKYLAHRPYKEVADLIAHLQNGIREISDGSEKENPQKERSKPKGFGNPE